MKKEKGFTLIELMIVIAIIAIIASIAIPSLLGARRSANETAAQKQMVNVAQIEGVWYKQDSDRNGTHDFWTYDYAGFYYAQNAGGTSIAQIDIASGNSDTQVTTHWTTLAKSANNGTALAAAVARNGYQVAVVTTDPSNTVYRVNLAGTSTLGSDTITASTTTICHTNEYAFCGYPSSYGQTGVAQYIVDQSAAVYQKDIGNGTAVSSWTASVAGANISPTTNGWSLATD